MIGSESKTAAMTSSEIKALPSALAADRHRHSHGVASRSAPSTCFTCTRLNLTTFRIVEDDRYSEKPFIYAKIYPSVVVLIDTGCGEAAKDPFVQLTSLRQFIETYPVEDNEGCPLNPGGQKGYAVVCTHCHFDHIGAIAQFTDVETSSIWASSNDRSFIEDDLPTTSLCRFVGMDTPKYKVTNWAGDGWRMTYAHGAEEPLDLGLVVYHTPGHTPDELAVWDYQERFVFVGDTMYEWNPILWAIGGNLQDYEATLFKLRDLIKGWNQEAGPERTVKMACGHDTFAADAEDLVHEVERFFSKVRRGLIERQDRGEKRGIPYVGYVRDDGRISFVGPKELFDNLRVGECPV